VTEPITALSEALKDRYRLERELGRGGMAVVWLAHDLRHDRPVALKVLHPHLGAAMGAERFQREIRLAARLQHPHILSVFDSGAADGLLWYTMPYVRGESLRERLVRHGRLPVDEALRITREAAQALQYAHGEGVIHRDIKPENILVAADGSTLVADFGIARSLGTGSDAAQQLTDTGLAIGTPAYMSPEQAMGDKSIDARTDQYALATVCWEMLAGALPFTGPTAAAVIAARMSVAPPSVRAARPEVSDAHDLALRRALAVRVDERFETVADFARAMRHEQLTPSGTPPAVTAATAGSTLLRRRTIVIALLTGVVALGALFASRRARSPSPVSGERRVAVLPFANLGDTSDADFADGVTDAVRGKLTALPGLTVIASTSSNEYRATRKAAGAIARELGVRYLLMGKVRWARTGEGTRVQVSPELVEVGTDGTPTIRWQQPFDASISNVFEVQGDIATQVAEKLGVALGATQHATLKARPTNNVEAYDAYVRGLRYVDRLAIPMVEKARAYMTQATTLDPEFGEAWAELARAWGLSYVLITPSPEAATNMEVAFENARRFAPTSPTTALAASMFQTLVRHDVDSSTALLRDALRRAPNDARLLALLGILGRLSGRFEETAEQLEKARALDPRSPQLPSELSMTLLFLRRFAEAERAADASLALNASGLDALEYKAIARVGLGDTAGARAVVQQAFRAADPREVAVHFAVYWDMYWLLGDEGLRILLAADSTAFGQNPGLRAMVFTQVYGFLGDRTRSRAYGDTAGAILSAHARQAPNDAQQAVLAGLALAYAGRGDSAVRAARSGLERSNKLDRLYLTHQLCRIHMLNGDRKQALDLLEQLLTTPYMLSPAWLRVDPNFAPLRGEARFEKLVAGR
jgi:serine/threonine-protein kinase